MTKKKNLERGWRVERRRNTACINNNGKKLYEKGARVYDEKEIDLKAMVPKWE